MGIFSNLMGMEYAEYDKFKNTSLDELSAQSLLSVDIDAKILKDCSERERKEILEKAINAIKLYQNKVLYFKSNMKYAESLIGRSQLNAINSKVDKFINSFKTFVSDIEQGLAERNIGSVAYKYLKDQNELKKRIDTAQAYAIYPLLPLLKDAREFEDKHYKYNLKDTASKCQKLIIETKKKVFVLIDMLSYVADLPPPPN